MLLQSHQTMCLQKIHLLATHGPAAALQPAAYTTITRLLGLKTGTKPLVLEHLIPQHQHLPAALAPAALTVLT